MTERKTLFSDLLLFLKELLDSNIEDPIQGTRGKDSKFIMTTFGERLVKYPMMTLEITNSSQNRAGMQSTRMDIELEVNIRIWAKSVTQSDKLCQQVLDLLAGEQFKVQGSVDNDFHDYTIGSVNRVDEPGKGAPKSRIIQLNYKFYNL